MRHPTRAPMKNPKLTHHRPVRIGTLNRHPTAGTAAAVATTMMIQRMPVHPCRFGAHPARFLRCRSQVGPKSSHSAAPKRTNPSPEYVELTPRRVFETL